MIKQLEQNPLQSYSAFSCDKLKSMQLLLKRYIAILNHSIIKGKASLTNGYLHYEKTTDILEKVINHLFIHE